MDTQRTSNRSLLAKKLIQRLPGRLQGAQIGEAQNLADLREIAPEALPLTAPVSSAMTTAFPGNGADLGGVRTRSKLMANSGEFNQLVYRLAQMDDQISDPQLLREALCLRAIVDAFLAESAVDRQLLSIGFEGGSGAVSSFELARGERALSIIAAMGGKRPASQAPLDLQVIIGIPGIDIETLPGCDGAPRVLSCSFIGAAWDDGSSEGGQILIRSEGGDGSAVEASALLAAIKDRLEHPELLLLV